MLHLLRIDLKKMTSYRTFWVICGLYFLTLGFTTASGMEILKGFERLGANFGLEVNIDRVPFYHFPDIWQNLIWTSGWFKIVLSIMVVISITNEFQYRTLRQNIIDGLSRREFVISKICLNVLLSLMSVGMIFIICLITGFIYSPIIEWQFFWNGVEFFFAYFLEILFFLSYAMLLGFLIQRSGLTIIILLLSQMIELIITANIDDHVPGLIPFFPMRSIWNLIDMPFPRYVLFEIKDYLELKSVLIVIFWTILFNYLAYLKLKRSDI
jgi:ABC-2 type transport system permease protein